MLPCGGVDDWIHINCAIWSAEAYEEGNGLVCSVHTAISRGLRLVRNSSFLTRPMGIMPSLFTVSRIAVRSLPRIWRHCGMLLQHLFG